MPRTPDAAKTSPDALLREYLARLDPAVQRLARAVRSALRKRLPTANELLYDYGKFFVIAYSPTNHPIDAPLSIAARNDGVCLYLNGGPKLKDPNKLLRGSGKATRFISLESAARLAHPDVEALLAAALTLAPQPFPPTGGGELILRGPAAKKAKPTGKRPAK